MTETKETLEQLDKYQCTIADAVEVSFEEVVETEDHFYLGWEGWANARVMKDKIDKESYEWFERIATFTDHEETEDGWSRIDD